MRTLMVYDQMVVGQELPIVECQYDEKVQGRILIALDEENPWYFKQSPWGDPITHHASIDNFPIQAVTMLYEYPYGWLHARQETEFINPLPLGKPFKVHSKISDKYLKRGKGYIVIESLVVDQDGIEILRSRNHGMIDDERIREVAKHGLHHTPPSLTEKYRKKSK